jgi:hypothetical protein
MYNRQIDQPTEFAIKTQLNELAGQTEADFRTEDSDVCDEKAIFEAPKTGGTMSLFVDENGESSYFVLSSGGDSMTVHLSEVSSIEFDFRPEDEQYRVVLSGERIADFGL